MSDPYAAIRSPNGQFTSGSRDPHRLRRSGWEAPARYRPDARTAAGRFIRRVREDLLKHVGGTPTAIQQALIDRAAWASLQVSTLESHLASGREVDEPGYLQWTTALMFALANLNNAPRPDFSPQPKWEATGPPLPSPPGSTQEDRAVIKIEIELLCQETAPATVDAIMALVVRLEHHSHIEPMTPARARKYIDMAHALSIHLDELGRWKLINTMLEHTVDRHRTAAALALGDTTRPTP